MIVAVDFGAADQAAQIEELVLLARSCGFSEAGRVVARRKAPDPATFIGSGKVEELALMVRELQPQAVIFSHPISPIHQRNLQRRLECTVIDRTGLILEIFAQRAKSHEGKLQVELAQLQYQATRLVRQWSHLERQRGGIGVRGGPGERQLELDRRMLDQKVKAIKARLAKVQTQRDTQRRSRLRSRVLRVSLVGYTNAGKSTLFNALTSAHTLAADQLFATLDTTTRRLVLDGCPEIALSDTVGFVRELPHMLVAAFKSTLQETIDADVLLHVVDASAPERDAQRDAVNAVLREIDAEDIPQWVIFNKIDRVGLEAHQSIWVDETTGRELPVFHLSALSGAGLADLRQALRDEAVRHADDVRAGMRESALNPIEIAAARHN